MSRLYGFNMFQQQEGGFTKHFVRECGKLLKQEADELLDMIEKDDGDTLNSLSYGIKKEILKTSINDITAYHFYLAMNYIDYVNEQTEAVKQLCADTGVLDQHFNYFDDTDFINFVGILHIQSEFLQEYKECLEGINRFVAYDDLTSTLYDDYKLFLVRHIKGFKDKSSAHVNLLIKEHAYSTWDAVTRKRVEFISVKSKFMKTVKLVGVAVQKTNREVKNLMHRVNKLRRASCTSNLIHTMNELNGLGIESKLKQHLNRNVNWENYVKDTEKDLNIICNEMYTAEVMVNGMRLKGMVDLRSISKIRPLVEEEREYIASITTQHKAMLSSFISLQEHVNDIMENIRHLMQQKEEVEAEVEADVAEEKVKSDAAEKERVESDAAKKERVESDAVEEERVESEAARHEDID